MTHRRPDPLLLTVPQGGFTEVGLIGGRFFDSSFTDPPHGTLVLGEISRGGGPLYYVPDPGFLSSDGFLLTNQFVVDPPVEPHEVRVTVTQGLHGGPVGVDDAGFTVALGQTLSIAAEQLLADDQGEGLS